MSKPTMVIGVAYLALLLGCHKIEPSKDGPPPEDTVRMLLSNRPLQEVLSPLPTDGPLQGATKYVFLPSLLDFEPSGRTPLGSFVNASFYGKSLDPKKHRETQDLLEYQPRDLPQNFGPVSRVRDSTRVTGKIVNDDSFLFGGVLQASLNIKRSAADQAVVSFSGFGHWSIPPINAAESLCPTAIERRPFRDSQCDKYFATGTTSYLVTSIEYFEDAAVTILKKKEAGGSVGWEVAQTKLGVNKTVIDGVEYEVKEGSKIFSVGITPICLDRTGRNYAVGVDCDGIANMKLHCSPEDKETWTKQLSKPGGSAYRDLARVCGEGIIPEICREIESLERGNYDEKTTLSIGHRFNVIQEFEALSKERISPCWSAIHAVMWNDRLPIGCQAEAVHTIETVGRAMRSVARDNGVDLCDDLTRIPRKDDPNLRDTRIPKAVGRLGCPR